ncbi:MAG: carboxylesterase family protein [Dehalococcoidales bacterium]|jgi:para-nitrobenzyl esterase
MQVVKTDKGYVSGAIIGEPGKEVSIFRGIPYAAPPVGDLRWRPPQPVTPWQGIRECTRFSAVCPQTVLPGTTSEFLMSEDCLYLNVITPAKKPKEKLPVMVWMHGGGYTMGGGNDKIWNNYRLPQNGVVVVSLTHRLGPFGLAAHPLLSRESPNGVSGNYLFLDLIESLKWIQKNIAVFGGDPDNVTIFGESGGGAKVSIMMASPMAKGLFHRAICESGTSLALDHGKTLAVLEKHGMELFGKLGVSTLEAARLVPWEQVLEASRTMLDPPNPGRSMPMPVWDAAIEGWMLPVSPLDAFRSGNINAGPFIACATLGELTGPGPLIMPFMIPAYVAMIAAVNKGKAKGYACVFDQVPENWRKEGCVSAHSIELPYVFGDWDDTTGWWRNISGISLQSGAKTTEARLTQSDKFISEAMMQLWAQFAKTGKPSVKGLVDWPAYEKSTDQYLLFNEKVEVKTGYSKIAQ